MSSRDCSICASVSNKWSKCPYCEFETCRPCIQRYVLEEPTPKCMNCRKEWTREIQNRELTAAFVKGPLQKHMANVLFDSQRALLPASLEIYEREKEIKIARKESSIASQAVYLRRSELNYYSQRADLDELLHYRTKINRPYKPRPDENILRELNAKIDRLYDIISEIEQDPVLVELEQTHITKLETYHRLREAYANPENNAEKHKPRFIRACPANDCRGFLSAQWKCGLCDLWTCPDCLVVKGPERDCQHTCNPDDVASANMVAKDSKPCPKCACVIFKIDGCDQMWCTICHTAFSWKTGRIETNRIHNPHFFEYQRKQNAAMPRAVGDIPCGRDLDIAGVRRVRILLIAKGVPDTYITRVMGYIRAAFHLQQVDIPGFRPDRVADFHNLRVKYISSEITEAEFRVRLARGMKKHDHDREIGEVLQMLSITIHEIMYRYFNEIETATMEEIVCSATLDEIDLLYEYANGCLLNISKVYGTLPFGVHKPNIEKNEGPDYNEAGLYRIRKQKPAQEINYAEEVDV